MKKTPLCMLISLGLLTLSFASPLKGQTQKNKEAEKANALVKHQKGAEKASIDQDKQAANAQELLSQQTNPKVISLLNEVEILMAKSTDRLEDANTNGDTIALQTEIIEKIYEAAKAREQ